VGPITYVFAPAYPFNRTRAERAVAFADSIAGVFGVPRLTRITYYLAANVDEMYRIMGLESDSSYAGVAGLAQPVNRQLFSGSPLLGEEYRHELTHLVVAPLFSGATSYAVSEGVPTWLGGTSGKDFPAAARELAAFLAVRPEVTLDSLLFGRYPPAQLYPAAAVLAAMVHEHGGVTAVRALFRAGGDKHFRTDVARLLERPWETVVSDWHTRVMGFASDPR
jgi:hypothetical protein